MSGGEGVRFSPPSGRCGNLDSVKILPDIRALVRRFGLCLAFVGGLGLFADQATAEPDDFQRDCPPPFDFGPLLMNESAVNSPIPVNVLRCETFVRAQWTVLSDGADALQAMSSRVAQGSNRLGALEAERRRVTEQIAEKQKRREQVLSLGEDQREPLLGRLTTEISGLASVLGTLNETINREYPAYSELSAPSAVDIPRLRSLLRDDEVVVQILVNDDATYIWAVSQDRIEWRQAAELGTEAMNAAVVELRRGLEIADVTRGRDLVAEENARLEAEAAPSDTSTVATPYNRVLAHKLYTALFGQVQATLTGHRTMIVVVNGSLSGVPLGVLVTEPPTGDDRNPDALRSTKWLADQHILVTLPSLSSLVALRCFSRGDDGGRRPAGCPPLSPQGAASLAVSDVPPLNFFGVGDPVLGAETGPGSRGSSTTPRVDAAFTGRLANVDILRSMQRLPGTRTELQAIADQFTSKGETSVIMLSEDAREPRLLSRVEGGTGILTNPDLARARYVSFATHGLLTGQGGEGSEPGLVLTPPTTATEADDGFLSASEAAQLQLSAEFVVLSACNTATADGTVGAEGLAGLGPAFFYAGARSLLVSHWAVSDNATAELMSGTFAALDAGQGRAAALQQSMRTVRNDRDHPAWAHPSYWAAFSFIGEPGR